MSDLPVETDTAANKMTQDGGVADKETANYSEEIEQNVVVALLVVLAILFSLFLVALDRTIVSTVQEHPLWTEACLSVFGSQD